jgi:hypothetical protein
LQRKAGSAKSPPPAATEQQREQIRLAVTQDSEAFRSVVKNMASSLGNNPRRLKQFVNLFRLRVFIAVETGLLDDGRLTLEKLGRFVALELAHPLFVAALERNPELAEAVRNAERGSVTLRWRDYKELFDLLDAPGGKLQADDIRRLFLVSKRVRTISLTEELPPNAKPNVQAPVMQGFLVTVVYDRIDYGVATSVAQYLRNAGFKISEMHAGETIPVIMPVVLCIGRGRQTIELAMSVRSDFPWFVAILPGVEGDPKLPDTLADMPTVDLREQDGFERLARMLAPLKSPPSVVVS